MSRTPSPLALLILLPFGVIFGGGGAFVLSIPVAYAFRVWESTSWVPVEAVVDEARIEAKESRDSDGHRTTNYQLQVQYHYTFNGQDYSSTSLDFFSSMWTNVSTTMHQRNDILQQAIESGDPVIALVDPDDPSRSVLFRDPEELVLALTTGLGSVALLIGLVFIIGCIHGFQDSLWESREARRYPGQPWMTKRIWNQNRIIDFIPVKRWVNVLITGILIFACSVFVWAFLYSVAKGFLVWKLFLLIPIAIAGYFIRNGVLKIIQWWRYGISHVVLEPYPGWLGESLIGAVHTSNALLGERAYLFQLTCHRKSRGGHQLNKVPVWVSKPVIVEERSTDAAGKCVIPFEIPLPDKEQMESGMGALGTYTWTMELTAQTTGPDFKTEFEVPVFNKPVEVSL